jgi:hypothetical protein
MDWNAREGSRWRACAYLRGTVVAGAYGPYFERFEAGTAYRANACPDHRAKGDDDRKEVGVALDELASVAFSAHQTLIGNTTKLCACLTEVIASNARQEAVFRSVQSPNVGDMFFQSHPSIDTVVSRIRNASGGADLERPASVSQWVDPINSASMMISLFVIVFLGSYLFRETGARGGNWLSIWRRLPPSMGLASRISDIRDRRFPEIQILR